jgi:hypothetical protein
MKCCVKNRSDKAMKRLTFHSLTSLLHRCQHLHIFESKDFATEIVQNIRIVFLLPV